MEDGIFRDRRHLIPASPRSETWQNGNFGPSCYRVACLTGSGYLLGLSVHYLDFVLLFRKSSSALTVTEASSANGLCAFCSLLHISLRGPEVFMHYSRSFFSTCKYLPFQSDWLRTCSPRASPLAEVMELAMIAPHLRALGYYARSSKTSCSFHVDRLIRLNL